jgi:hypothetical protein
MKVRDLSEVMQRAYHALPSPEQKEAFLEECSRMRNNSIRSVPAAIMTRNLSHGIRKVKK